MEAREPVLLNAIGATGIGLQVRFAWRADRHVHTISLIVDDRPIPVLESIEGSSIDNWPPSPPLQQLSVEPLKPEKQVALLVGMAGKSHWSMSVEPASERAALVFDVACRSKGTAEQIGSGYLLSADSLATSDDHDATIDVKGQSVRLRCDRGGATAAVVKDGPSGPRIEPTTVNSSGTTRWRYTIELS